jgi:hypothetical protein
MVHRVGAYLSGLINKHRGIALLTFITPYYFVGVIDASLKISLLKIASISKLTKFTFFWVDDFAHSIFIHESSFLAVLALAGSGINCFAIFVVTDSDTLIV